jgi:hypothetical protein
MDHCQNPRFEKLNPPSTAEKVYPRYTLGVSVSDYNSDFTSKEIPLGEWPRKMPLVKYHPQIADEIRARFCQHVEFRFENFKLELQPYITRDCQEEGRYNYLEAKQLELLYVFDHPNALPWLKHIRFCKVKARVEDDFSWQGAKVSDDEEKLEERRDSGRYIKIAKLAWMLNRLENAKKIEITLQIWRSKSASRPRTWANSQSLFKALGLF